MNEAPSPHISGAPDYTRAHAASPMLLPSQALGVPGLTNIPHPDADAGADTGAAGGPSVDAYYDRERREFLTRNTGGRWLAMNDTNFKRVLRAKGFSMTLSPEDLKEGRTVSEVDGEILALQDTRDVGYAGPLAGRPAGFYVENGERILVTASPQLLTPAPDGGEEHWPLIRCALTGLLAGAHEPEAFRQWEIILGWLAAAVQSLYLQQHRPGQALVLAGPAGCGKSVLQNLIITPLLGGRAAKCAPYLQGRTDFNSDLFRAEHLMLEDEHSDTRITSRLALASHIKQICVNLVQPCHAKHRPIINLSPFWRLSISLNDEPERLLIIPPLGGDIAEKIIILRCCPFTWPMEIGTLHLWEAFTTALRAELPAFLTFLLAHEVPPGPLRSDRYGIAAWHHPELSGELDDMAPEAHLAILIQRWLGERREWKGTADELRTALLDDETTARDARELLHWQNACGTYLGRLLSKPRPPLTLHMRRIQNQREWTINVSQP